MNKKLLCLIIAISLFIPAVIIEKVWGFFPLYFPLYLIAYFTVGWNVIRKAFINITHGEVFDENFLMLIASIGAFVLNLIFGFDKLFLPGGGEEMMDGVAVMILYEIGEYLQSKAVKQSRKNIKTLLAMRPDSAIIIEDGVEKEVFPDEIEVGKEFIVHPGSKVALDGVISKGSGYFDTSAITGESEPIFLETKDNVLSGFISLDSNITICANKPFEQSTASRMLSLIELASEKKSKEESFITKFAMVYTPIVCILSLLIAIIPPFLTLLISGDNVWNTWIYNALCLLVISCPCALVISVPLTFFGGIGGLSQKNILIKGGDCFEKIAKANVVAMDKTGTITTGKFEVNEINGEDKELVLKLAASCEKSFSHPIAKSICDYYKGELLEIQNIKDYPGKGIIGNYKNSLVIVGNEKLLNENGIVINKVNSPFTIVYVAYNGINIGNIICADSIKDTSANTIKELNASGIKTIMLTGDKQEVADAIGRKININEVRASLLPEDKVNEINALKLSNNKVIYVGDGINDGPALVAADIGCAMGGMGSDVAIEAADLILMKDSLQSLLIIKKHSKKVIRIANENIYGSLVIKLTLMILTIALPFFPLYLAIVGDVGVCLLAIMNAMRTLKIK